MKRLGLFTGKIYGDDVNAHRIEECCLLVSDKQASNDTYIKQQHSRNIKKCGRCMGCPEAQKSKK